MSFKIDEIKVFDNPKLLERYMRSDDAIMFDIAKEMMSDSDRLTAVMLTSSNSVGIGLYNLDTKENIITQTPKYLDSTYEDNREVGLLLSSIFRDLSSAENVMLNMYSKEEIEKDITVIAQNNIDVKERNVSVSMEDKGEMMIEEDKSILTTGSLFSDDYLMEEAYDFKMVNLKEYMNDVGRMLNTEIPEEKELATYLTQEYEQALEIENEDSVSIAM